MHIKIVIDFKLSAQAKRTIRWIALPVAVFAGTAATVALANVVTSGTSVPVVQFDAGSPMSAESFTADFKNIQTRLDALERQATLDGGYSVNAVYCGLTDATLGDLSTLTSLGSGVGQGYAKAKAYCQAACAGSKTAHMCSGEELARSAQQGSQPNVDGWYETGSGIGGPAANTGVTNDCLGWTSLSSSSWGPLWLDEGAGIPAPGGETCSTSEAVLCCD